ncbi:hypothetical protein O6H91_01G116600 [Diphasiastrum complanatum]|uniref:Uncharacterized protein n=8 Tax=Diphasiastrum complanatum TaxID=34168 RepID=A0ACC2EVG2_DIPCM|nr:hypothetical protein O6H91_01G010400 [Diphasiastrum complanatum]KAJ7567863.1 hypothetical protein O6H91_01G010400 [Diphasiastrum complanatum]KAJ7567864.1 hypothetical protein O6H91_01G010400 [Diphasiastrum complanatum]KAJ7567865.1 hypothetical protein O6H91_01G010400 [Diphasiastrum complanatum]KAJ7570348.1 hypothetical protein O6H91_01G116600 [Diphasiastrum complanatum]
MNESEESTHSLLSGDFSGTTNPSKLNYYGLNGTRQLPAWLDVKVLYVRVSFGPPDESPDVLIMRFPQRSIETALEVNGGRISPSEETSLILRRDRVDKDSLEVTYVTTDKLRAVGCVTFEIYENEEILVCGVLLKADTSDMQGLIGYDSSASSLTKSITSGWAMECNCVVRSMGCSFLKGRHDYASLSYASPAMEVCVVGQYSSTPVILTQTVELAARKRTIRHGTLDAIPEDKECGVPQNMILTDLDGQVADERLYGDLDGKVTAIGKYYGSEGGGGAYLEGDDGDISWFNAGVRVGVGIGLGMCLGIGIGVGLLVRTYQVATKSFRKQLF